MCWIIGVVWENHFETSYKALRALEYRGYDSFWFWWVIDGSICILRKVWAIWESDFNEFSILKKSTVSIGHTRWATHGKVAEHNSHPHMSNDNQVAIVHNWVIANFAELKQTHKNWNLYSETDTEVAANVIAESIQNSNSLLEWLKGALIWLEGEFAICWVLKGGADTLFAMKRKSPLIIGKKNADILIASDKTALAEFSESMDIAYLDDNVVVVYKNWELQSEIYENGVWKPYNIVFHTQELQIDKSILGDYPHYMIKEISESPEVGVKIKKQVEAISGSIIEMILNKKQCCITGSWSAYYVSMIAQYFFKEIANTYCVAHPSDEFLNLYTPSKNNVIIWVSQSGETFDTLEVIREAKLQGSSIVSINNVSWCSMQNLADYPIFQNSWKEVCVLSTKSIVSQVSALLLLAMELWKKTGALSSAELIQRSNEYTDFPSTLHTILKDVSQEIQRVAYQNCHIEHWFFIGRGAHYPVALESALKFKEVSYLHAEGMPAGFFKHGTISLIDENFYTVVFLPSKIHNKELFQLTIDNIHEIRARGGKVIGFGFDIDEDSKENLFLEYIKLPDVNNELNIVSQLVAGQLFAYYCAVALGRNIDRPRALAKSVTVR